MQVPDLQFFEQERFSPPASNGDVSVPKRPHCNRDDDVEAEESKEDHKRIKLIGPDDSPREQSPLEHVACGAASLSQPVAVNSTENILQGVSNALQRNSSSPLLEDKYKTASVLFYNRLVSDLDENELVAEDMMRKKVCMPLVGSTAAEDGRDDQIEEYCKELKRLIMNVLLAMKTDVMNRPDIPPSVLQVYTWFRKKYTAESAKSGISRSEYLGNLINTCQKCPSTLLVLSDEILDELLSSNEGRSKMARFNFVHILGYSTRAFAADQTKSFFNPRPSFTLNTVERMHREGLTKFNVVFNDKRLVINDFFGVEVPSETISQYGVTSTICVPRSSIVFETLTTIGECIVPLLNDMRAAALNETAFTAAVNAKTTTSNTALIAHPVITQSGAVRATKKTMAIGGGGGAGDVDDHTTTTTTQIHRHEASFIATASGNALVAKKPFSLKEALVLCEQPLRFDGLQFRSTQTIPKNCVDVGIHSGEPVLYQSVSAVNSVIYGRVRALTGVLNHAESTVVFHVYVAGGLIVCSMCK